MDFELIKARILGGEDGTDSGGQTSASTQLLQRTDKWAPHVSGCPWWDLGWRELDRVGPKPVPGPRALLYFLSVFLFIFHFPFPISSSFFNKILNSNFVINLSSVWNVQFDNISVKDIYSDFYFILCSIFLISSLLLFQTLILNLGFKLLVIIILLLLSLLFYLMHKHIKLQQDALSFILVSFVLNNHS